MSKIIRGKSCTINGTSQFCDGAIVYDALGGARSAYLVWYQQYGGYSGNGGWYKSGGPHSTELRNPITNSYWSPKDNCWRQDFQMGWLCYENRRSYDSGDVAPASTILGAESFPMSGAGMPPQATLLPKPTNETDRQ